MSLHVLEPGLLTLVVDLGRPASRRLGVPVGGAADRASFLLGNALVGNPPEAAGLEVSLAGPTLEAACFVAGALCGAPFGLHSDRQALAVGKTFTLSPGERLRISGARRGMRAYLCVRGGLQTQVILGSRSGLQPLSAGMEIPCLPGSIRSRFVETSLHPSLPATPIVLRVLSGLQKDWFDDEDLQHREFAVRPASNRMGLRLEGEPLALPPRELVSEPVCPGAVQVTRDGQCIVLGVDGQTIGGYPKIAQVIHADLDCLGQLRPGDRLRFQPVSLDEAVSLDRERRRQWRDIQQRLLLTAT